MVMTGSGPCVVVSLYIDSHPEASLYISLCVALSGLLCTCTHFVCCTPMAFTGRLNVLVYIVMLMVVSSFLVVNSAWQSRSGLCVSWHNKI